MPKSRCFGRGISPEVFFPNVGRQRKGLPIVFGHSCDWSVNFSGFDNVVLKHMTKRGIDSQLLERNHLISFGGENDNAEGKDV